MTDFDLIVVGAGPAGLSTAIHAAQAGLRTVVFDSRTGPIDKACAEGLMPVAVHNLRSLGIRLDGMPFRGIKYIQGGRSVEAIFRNGPGMGVRRTTLSAALLERAANLKVPVVAQSVDDITQDAESVTAGGYTARFLAAADGLHSPIRRQLGLDRPAQTKARFGLRQHFSMTPWSDFVEVYWGRNAEVYVTPIADDIVGVAVLSSSRASFADHLSAFPDLSARLAVDATKVRGAGPLRQNSTARTLGRVHLVGVAAGYVVELTVEGIALAVSSGKILAECLAADRGENYEKAWRTTTRRYRQLTAAMVWIARQRLLRNAVVPVLATCPPLFRAGVSALAR